MIRLKSDVKPFEIIGGHKTTAFQHGNFPDYMIRYISGNISTKKIHDPKTTNGHSVENLSEQPLQYVTANIVTSTLRQVLTDMGYELLPAKHASDQMTNDAALEESYKEVLAETIELYGANLLYKREILRDFYHETTRFYTEVPSNSEDKSCLILQLLHPENRHALEKIHAIALINLAELELFTSF